MMNLALAAIALVLWGGAYAVYFGPQLRRWWSARRERKMGKRTS